MKCSIWFCFLSVASEKKRVEDAVIVCSICLDNPNYQCVLRDCGHAFCLSCVSREDFSHCPFCKKRRSEIIKVNVNSLMIVDKSEVAKGFHFME